MKVVKDGWHEYKDSKLRYYVKDGKLLRGVAPDQIGEKTVYPYEPSPRGGLDNISGCPATRYWIKKAIWR